MNTNSTATAPNLTDKEKLVALLTEFGVGFKKDENKQDANDIVCEKGDALIEGYNGFYTAFLFDDQGKFKGMGAWE